MPPTPAARPAIATPRRPHGRRSLRRIAYLATFICVAVGVSILLGSGSAARSLGPTQLLSSVRLDDSPLAPPAALPAAEGESPAAPADSAAPATAPEVAPVLAFAPVRVPRPAVPPGPRRVGLQAGHWQTEQVPEELRRLESSTGSSWNGLPEWQLNFQVANRAAGVLRTHGYEVDVLPTTVLPGYLADVFLALHADGDSDGLARGYKAAHSSRRGPYEDRLVDVIMEEYGRATSLPVDPKVTRNMLGYYAFSWRRYEYAVAPHTPAAILEMGFLTSAADRALLLGRQDLVAAGVANGVLRFLDEVPAGAAFAEDIILPPFFPFTLRPPSGQGQP